MVLMALFQAASGGLAWAASQEALVRSMRLSAGDEHVILVREDGSLWTAGGNAFGQVGNGSLEPQRQLQQPSFRPRDAGKSWRKVSAGAHYSMAIREDSTLWSFGKNNSAQLGRDMRKPVLRPWQTGKNQWLDVAAGVTATLAIRADSSLRIWGGWSDEHQAGEILKGLDGQSRLLAPGQWAAVAMGADHALALRGDGTLWVAGNNQARQLGCAETASLHALCRVGEEKWLALAAGTGFSVALRDDGTLWSWGANAQGELGRGMFSESEGVGQVGDEKWLAISAGQHHVLALRADSTLWVWGSGADGALGLGGVENRNQPTQVDQAAWLAIAAGPRSSLAQRADGRYGIWGRIEGWRGPGAMALRPRDLMNLEGGNDSLPAPSPEVVPVAELQSPASDLASVTASAPAPSPVVSTLPTSPSKPSTSVSLPTPASASASTPPSSSPSPRAPTVSPSPRTSASASSSSNWVADHKTWLVAGGGALAVGGLLWAVLGMQDVGSLPLIEPDLGLPPDDPITGGAR